MYFRSALTNAVNRPSRNVRSKVSYPTGYGLNVALRGGEDTGMRWKRYRLTYSVEFIDVDYSIIETVNLAVCFKLDMSKHGRVVSKWKATGMAARWAARMMEQYDANRFLTRYVKEEV